MDMKPYMIVEGHSQAIEAFEKKVADALELGYSLAGELVAHPQSSDLKLYQPMLLEEEFDEDEEDEDEDWDEEDEADDN
jgi:hypothetical protein